MDAETKTAKTHYAAVDRANESDNNDYWGRTACGLDECESPMSNRIEEITCKRCLKRINQTNKTSKQNEKISVINIYRGLYDGF